MQGRQEKSSTNGTKTLVKKEGVSYAKSNGAVKRLSDSHGHKKDLPWKPSANGVKLVVKKDPATSTKPNGTYTKRELEISAEKKKEASSSGVKTVVKKSVTVSKVTSVKTEEKKKKQVFTLPGQKHEAPEERDPLRIFYESLHEQLPESEMAEVWMMEHGLLEATDAKKALERKQRRVQNEKNGTPIKSTSSRDVSSKPGNKSVSGNKQSGSGNKSAVANGKSKIVAEQKGKRKREYSSDDDDFIVKPVKRKLKP
ncbi:unnamed protein product [Calypogeia fissa]